MAYCRVLLCNINKKSSCCNGGFLFISNKHLVTFHFPLAIYRIHKIVTGVKQKIFLTDKIRIKLMK